ncbi:hypothetical protein BTO30_02995 [Domibacillus antri]|uniref:Uncharacterized protein n=1 Tax=Domibacillus antri TaxID=1714264 RepID=A0A1Q8Q8R8_9BACI|nr:hypothetical protein [Domibacillus antri]OLN23720.1 hypothetical protein BTO30_02995 [Domibacillus antri]
MDSLNRRKIMNLMSDTQAVVNGMKKDRISKRKIARVTNHQLVFESMSRSLDEKTAKAGALALLQIEAVRAFALAYNERLVDFSEIEKMGAKVTDIAEAIEKVVGA